MIYILLCVSQGWGKNTKMMIKFEKTLIIHFKVIQASKQNTTSNLHETGQMAAEKATN